MQQITDEAAAEEYRNNVRQLLAANRATDKLQPWQGVDPRPAMNALEDLYGVQAFVPDAVVIDPPEAVKPLGALQKDKELVLWLSAQVRGVRLSRREKKGLQLAPKYRKGDNRRHLHRDQQLLRSVNRKHRLFNTSFLCLAFRS